MLAAFALCLLPIQDVGAEKRRLTLGPDKRVELDFQHYYKTRELRIALSSLAATYPEFVQLETPGKSRGGEDLWVVRLGDNANSDPATKPAMFIYAAEGLSNLQGTELALASLVEFLQENARQERVGRALRETTMYFMPCGNPDLRTLVLDGLESGSSAGAFTNPRVDLERNYPVGWGPFHDAGAALSQGPGPYPLSEPETRQVASFLISHENIGVVVGFAPSAFKLNSAVPSGAQGLEPESLRSLRDGQSGVGGALLEFTGRTADERGCFDDFAYGQFGAWPLRVLVGDIDAQTGLALPRTDEIGPQAKRVAASLLALSEALPRLAIAGTSVQRLKNDLWQVELSIANNGQLRTQSGLGSARNAVAAPRLQVRGGKVLGAGLRALKSDSYASIPVDDGQVSLSELEGGAQLRARVLVLAPAETSLELTVSSPRAGTVTAALVLR